MRQVEEVGLSFSNDTCEYVKLVNLGNSVKI